MKNDAKPRGRPRTFDEAAALQIARDLFWERGYDGTSMKDLVVALGMTPPSIYAAFGSKDGLYDRVLDCYAESFGKDLMADFFDCPDLRTAVRNLMMTWARLLAAPAHPKGCMISVGMISHAPDNARIAQDLAARRRTTKGLFLSRLTAGKDQLPVGTKPDVLANYLAMAITGLSVLARDGATTAELTAVAELALTIWPD
jgi:TetR/AcrR family transcriptional regulator, copper-responsive repressor